MSDKDDFLKANPNIKLNEWNEEEIDIPVVKPVLDKNNNRVSFEMGTQKAKQRTYYANSTPRMVVCKDHSLYPLDPKKYIFKCENCDFHYKGNTLTHKYNPDTKKLVYRSTGRNVV